MTPPKSLEVAAARLEEIAPGYLDRVRRRAAELSVPRTRLAQVQRSIDMVVQTARIDPNAPVESRSRPLRLVKRVVGKLMRFYMLYLSEQVIDLGESTSWMGTALCDYVAGLETEVAELRERVARLEEARDRP